jgi:hypothetical protein
MNASNVAIASHPILGYPVYHDLHEESTVCRRLQWARSGSCASSTTASSTGWTPLGHGSDRRFGPRRLRAKPNPKRVWHEPRFTRALPPSRRARWPVKVHDAEDADFRDGLFNRLFNRLRLAVRNSNSRIRMFPIFCSVFYLSIFTADRTSSSKYFGCARFVPTLPAASTRTISRCTGRAQPQQL